MYAELAFLTSYARGSGASATKFMSKLRYATTGRSSQEPRPLPAEDSLSRVTVVATWPKRVGTSIDLSSRTTRQAELSKQRLSLSPPRCPTFSRFVKRSRGEGWRWKWMTYRRSLSTNCGPTCSLACRRKMFPRGAHATQLKKHQG